MTWWGGISWLGAGLVLGIVLWLLPPWRPRPLSTFAATLFGAMAGGALASALGFGGAAAFDVRSLVTAALLALVLALAVAVVHTQRERARQAERA